MTITLPNETILPPRWRILRKRAWSNQAWQPLPMLGDIGPGGKQVSGFFVEEFWRSCIPEPGQATLRYNFGVIDGVQYGYDADGEELDIDLIGQCVRIQVADEPEEYGNTPDWRTVWVGVVEHQEDKIAPGADYVIGDRFYHCYDLLTAYAKRQPVNRHGVYIDGAFFVGCFGHPGYNGLDWEGRVYGNRESTNTTWQSAGPSRLQPWYTTGGSKVDTLADDVFSDFLGKMYNHSHPGAGAVWTDLQAIEHALATSRQPGSPWFYCVGATDLLSGSHAWPIDLGSTAWDFLMDMFKRQRGRGLAFLDWEDDLEDPDGDLVPFIRINPQTLADITYTPPGGSPTTLPGATTQDTTKAVDLEGDHRNVAETFRLGDRYQHVFDYVESVGERIEVLTTLDYDSDSLESRWTEDEEDAFTAAEFTARKVGRWEPVWQLHGLAKAWNGKAGNGNGATPTRADYRCADDGSITTPSATDAIDTSPVATMVMHDIPVYVGYDYSGATPARYDGQTEELAPARKPPIVLVKIADDRYLGEALNQCSFWVSEYGIKVTHSGDQESGVRYFSGEDNVDAGGTVDKESLVISVCLELPHRVRMASGDAAGVRKKLLYHKGLHLWLAHPLAIWELSETTYDADGWAAKRDACPQGSGPGILRDDRAKLAREHAMAASWYLTERRTATWQLKACGFLPSFAVEDDAVEYPTIGQLITTMAAGGLSYAINTPITKVHFTNRSNGVTTWLTDWCDLDLR